MTQIALLKLIVYAQAAAFGIFATVVYLTARRQNIASGRTPRPHLTPILIVVFVLIAISLVLSNAPLVTRR